VKIRQLSGIALIGLLTLSTVAFADTANLSETQKKQIETVVHDYLIKNPEILVQSMQVLQQRQMEQAQKSVEKTQQLSPKYVDELFRNAKDPVVGNPTGKVTMVEFFDYQCPHCTAMEPVLEAAVKANPDLRVVYKEFPIRGPMSDLASRVALVAQNQGKYSAFHTALMNVGQLPLTEEIIYKVAKDSGLDVEKTKKDIKDKAIDDQIKTNMKLGQQLQLMGTPAIFAAKSDVKQNASPQAITFIPGQINQDQIVLVLKQIQ